MTGGILQLIARGKEDKYITKHPEITFFKRIYRRHTLFSQEHTRISFSNQLNFGKKTSALITNEGDLINDMYIVITLPAIKIVNKDQIKHKFAWKKNIGYVLINKVEIEINGSTIDRHTGDWMKIMSDLTFGQSRNIDKLVGNVPELTEFSEEKSEYTLYIPLFFWFCRSPGDALPLISLQLSTIRIIVEIADLAKCVNFSPTHNFRCQNSLVTFSYGALIKQKNSNAVGTFNYFDTLTKKIFYTSESANVIIQDPLSNVISDGCPDVIVASSSISCSTSLPKMAQLKDCHILANYIYLDGEEREMFVKKNHEYIIDQVFITSSVLKKGNTDKVNINMKNSCKLVVWGIKQNYNDTYINSISSTMLFNNKERETITNKEIFEYLQQYQYFKYKLQNNLNAYSFSFFPLKTQPSGAINSNMFNDISLLIRNESASINNEELKIYSLCCNVLRISNGFGGLAFPAYEV